MQFVVTASLQSLKLFVKSLLCLHRVSPHLLLVATATDVRRRLASRRTPPRLAHARAQAQFEEKRVSQTFLSPWAAQAVCAQRVGHVLLPNVVCVHLLSLVPSARGEERVHGLAQGERALLPGPTPPPNPNQRLDSAQACLAVFRSLATIEKCQVRLDRAEQNLVFDLTCLSDAKKVSCAHATVARLTSILAVVPHSARRQRRRASDSAARRCAVWLHRCRQTGADAQTSARFR
jgi:hypothetical protein